MTKEQFDNYDFSIYYDEYKVGRDWTVGISTVLILLFVCFLFIRTVITFV